MAEHGSKLIRTLRETALYPPHPPRKATALYNKSHHRLVVELDRPCLVCGVRNSDLQDPARRNDSKINPWGAKQLESHHRIVEDSLANAIDVAKFNKHIVPGLLKHTGDEAKFGHDFTQDEMVAFIHGDELNLWILCDVHHRHSAVGIHSITYSVWSVQHLLLDNYDLTGYTPPTPQEAAQIAALPTTQGVAVPVPTVPSDDMP